MLHGQLRWHPGEVFRKRAEQKASKIEEGRLMSDQVHMMSSIRLKCAMSQVVGFIKNRNPIHPAQTALLR